MKKLLFTVASIMAACALNAQNLTIVHYNDTHSHLEPVRTGESAGKGGVIERAAYVDSLQKAVGKKNMLLLHAGDFNQGSSYFTELHGIIEARLVNAMGYDVVTLGNHEFDNGLEDLAGRLAMLKCPVVCANYVFDGSPVEKYVRPCTIVRKAGMKIGIFGMLPDIMKVVDVRIASALSKKDDVQVANEMAKYLREVKKCDYVIMLSHLGFQGKGSDTAIIPRTSGIDLVVGGHSHTFLEDIVYVEDAAGKKVPIVQNGCWGLQNAELTVKF